VHDSNTTIQESW